MRRKYARGPAQVTPFQFRINLPAQARLERLPPVNLRSCPIAVLVLLGLTLHGSLPTQAAERPRTIYTYDARPLNGLDLKVPGNAMEMWDTLHALFALQGLANRAQPHLYVFYCNGFNVQTDEFWFAWFREEDGWLKDAEVRTISSLEEAIESFRGHFRGLVVYDPLVPATSNLGSTAAGCEDLLPVRYDPRAGSVYDRLVVGMKLPVNLWLVKTNGESLFTGKGKIPGLEKETTGSPKADAYLWALDRWVYSAKAAPGTAAYYMDAYWLKHPTRAGADLHTLSNHDYFIARRAFFFDLAPWADEPPNDEPGQRPGVDRQVFLEVMRALYDRSAGEILQIGGFTPWPHKYTSHSVPKGKHEPVPTEWEFARLISQFNGYMEADAAGLSSIANASFARFYPLDEVYRQPRRPNAEDWRRRGLLDAGGKPVKKLFLGHYVGDYDAPSWVYKAVPAFFRDPARGKVPLGWAFNPNLADRAPQALVYSRRHASSNDWFVAGDSGAGYLNARALTVRPESGLPSGLGKWTRHCQDYYRRWDLTITGFLLDGSAGASTDVEYRAYLSFSPDGIGTHFERGPAMKPGIPTCPERDLPDNVDKAAEVILAAAREQRGKTAFFWARSILKSPKWYADLSERLETKDPEGIVVVDPYTFFGLVKLHLGDPGS
jgi:hypothetical protein